MPRCVKDPKSCLKYRTRQGDLLNSSVPAVGRLINGLSVMAFSVHEWNGDDIIPDQMNGDVLFFDKIKSRLC